MNKGQQFWVDLWREGRTHFHREEVNPDLIAYWSQLNLTPKATVFVPLCGKSLDMLWLVQQGFNVVGIELSEQAVIQFAMEHQLHFQKETRGGAHHYYTDSISLWVADIFAFESSFITPVDAIYDRAALIALPAKLRSLYADICLRWLKPQGAILLKTLSYNQDELEGPPFSVSDEEVTCLYKQCLEVKRLKVSDRPQDSGDSLFQRGLRAIKDSVWCIRKA
ncbi:thiopurine S-methyltransferase [Legionella maioricensis]|uniref:Thiopurine S-methyltransferase n=1 Tax=Legionella maioricensis TaxID=2896528 RepID=A0A9X2IBP4_9GAMM|nr:thiopurine S-methyltransferase [Legionella maioricensis]MCL9689117.1 thiopurine S-methyltransferase [Legionella maioricensis]